jgi:hypothetical protein
MSAPVFLLQIVSAKDGTVATLPAGGPLERDLVQCCTAAIVKRGVGVFRSEAHVRQAIAEGIAEALLDLKRETRGIV